MNFPTLDSKFFDSPAIRGASSGCALSIASNWIPTIWTAPNADPASIETKVNAISQRSLFSGALAGAITEELSTEVAYFAKHGVPKLWDAAVKIFELSKNSLKLAAVGGTYVGISSLEHLFVSPAEPSYTEDAIRKTSTFLGNLSLSILNQFPITQDLVEPLRGIASTISETTLPIFEQIGVEPAKLSAILGGLYITHLIVSSYQDDFIKWKNSSINSLGEASGHYLKEIIPGAKVATSYYLGIAIEEKLGTAGSAIAAAAGIPLLYIAREAASNGSLSKPLWKDGKSVMDLVKAVPVLPALAKLETMVTSFRAPSKVEALKELVQEAPTKSTEEVILEESLLSETPLSQEEEAILSNIQEQEVLAAPAEMEPSQFSPWSIESTLSSLYITSEKVAFAAFQLFSSLPAQVYSLYERISLSISHFFGLSKNPTERS